MLFFAHDPMYEDAPCVQLREEEKELFFSSSGSGYKKAQKICVTKCPKKIRDHCLDKALEFEYGLDEKHRSGVWGGTTVQDRIRIEQGEEVA